MPGWKAVWGLLLCGVGAGPLPALAAGGQTETPLALVVLSRHGVRSPTQDAATLAQWSAKPWPVWHVGRGELSARGAGFARAMGQAYRQRLGWSMGCPGAGRVSLYADLDQRTLATGAAVLEGLAPGCALPLRHRAGAKPDPLFHPVEAGVCALDRARAAQAITAMAGGSLAVYAQRDRASAERLQQVLGPTPDSLCASAGVAAPCRLVDLPTRIVPRQRDGHADIGLGGGLALASDAAEVLLLDSAEFPGRPAPAAAALASMLKLHVAAFDLNQRTPYLAALRGSAVLDNLLTRLAHAAQPGAPVFSGLIGHDTNIANVAALLGASWHSAGWPADATPPAGALVFEVYAGRNGRRELVPTFWAQPLAALQRVSTQAPPQRVVLALDACPGGRCALDDFVRQMRARVAPACVPAP